VLTTDYVGNIIYENGTLKQIMLPDGYWQNGVFYYYLKDHLGSNRVTINSSGTVVEKSHYYPSGTRFYTESTSNSNALAYRYNGKEMETMNGLNQMDYGARRRFAGLPIWTGMDKKAELYYSVSPYVYSLNDPVNAIDPDGRIVIFINGFTPFKSEQGTPAYWQRERTANIYSREGKVGTKKYTESFDGAVIDHFNENKNEALYFDGSLGGVYGILFNESTDAISRYANGYVQGEASVAGIIKGLARSGGVITESIKVIAHSMGGAYAKGFIQSIVDYVIKHPEECKGLSISEYDFASFQQNKQSAIKGVSLFQYDNDNDEVVSGIFGALNGSKHAKEKNAEDYDSNTNNNGAHSIFDYYGTINNLPEGTYKFENGKFIKTN